MKAFVLLLVAMIILFLILAIWFQQDSFGEEIDDLKLASAIFNAEGGYKATYLYGIRSVKYKDEIEAKRICLNTIRNQRKRHANHNCELTYLECLAKRYCPIGAKNDPQGLNRHWLKNVRYFLRRQ